MELFEMYQNELKALIEKHAPREGGGETAIASLRFFRTTTPTEFLHTMYEPSLCLIAQGAKAVGVGETLMGYDEKGYLLASVHLPARVQIQQASHEKPYLSLQLVFSMEQIVAILKEMKMTKSTKKEDAEHGIFIGEHSTALLEPVVRLARLLDTPEDIAMLAPAIIKEILYRVLKDEGGSLIRQFASAGSLAERIAKAISLIKQTYTEPLRIETLSKVAGMSSSSLHFHFKRITSMSPLQFQKSLRLQEARKLLLVESLDATKVAFQVGYESPSQFSREYTRLFGLPPIKDRTLAIQQS